MGEVGMFVCFIVLAALFGLAGYLQGATDEIFKHRPHCLCPECKKWREEMRQTGKEPDGPCS